VAGAGWLRVDLGTERAAWLEFTSADLNSTGQEELVTAAVSEYDEPYKGKTQPLTAYEGGNYRLETNLELFEGARFIWLCFAVDCPPSSPGERTLRCTATLHCFAVALWCCGAATLCCDSTGTLCSQ
jgi:hypothetical protein